MSKVQQLAGVSARALLALATPALAQENTNVVTSGGGTNNVAVCDNVPFTANTCIITQNGSNNQGGVSQGGNNNTATITQIGDGSSGTVEQFDGLNGLSLDQGGARNRAFSEQKGPGNRAELIQSAPAVWADSGNPSNVLTIRQRSDPGAGSAANVATIRQTQTGSAPNSVDFFDQIGANIARFTQIGSGHSARLEQGQVQYRSPSSFEVVGLIGLNNLAVSTQSGNGTASEIRQGSRADGEASQQVRDNFAQADLSGTSGAIRRSTASSVIIQGGVANAARVFVFGGDGAENASEVRQGGRDNEAFTSIGRGSNQISRILQGARDNFADVTMTSGQDGEVQNLNTLGRSSVLRRWNLSQVGQSGAGSTALVVIGAQRGAQDMGYANTLRVDQRASAAYQARGLARTGPASATREGLTIVEYEAGDGARARGHFVQTYQFGRVGDAGIDQSDNVESGRVYADGAVARPRAALFQGGNSNVAYLSQIGDNYGEINQGRNSSADAANTVNLSQRDEGDRDPSTRDYNVAVATQYGIGNTIRAVQSSRGAFLTAFQREQSSGSSININQGATGSVANVLGTDRLTAMATQGGRSHRAEITQAGNEVVAISNQLGASNRITTSQITRSSRLTANQNGTQLAAIINQGVASQAPGPMTVVDAGNTATVTQAGSNSGATIKQNGTGLAATIEQSGSNPFPPGSASPGVLASGFQSGNAILVDQRGQTHTALARQTANVGRSSAAGRGGNPASGDQSSATQFPFSHNGGDRSAEIVIYQSGERHAATIVQDGLGQFAWIDQSGQRNVAGIDQRFNATNASAIIQQSGSDNSYHIVQTQPGQYISVRQTGTANSVNEVAVRGPTGGGSSNGFTPPPGP